MKIISGIVSFIGLVFLAYFLHTIGFQNEQIMATLIALCSMLVAAGSYIVGHNTLQHSIEHDIRSVMPRLQIWVRFENSDNDLKIVLQNCGIGPACIRDSIKNTAEDLYNQVLEIVSHQLNDRARANRLVMGVARLTNILLPPNAEETLIHIKFDGIHDTDRLQILKQISKLSIHFDYLDIYEIEYLNTEGSYARRSIPQRPYSYDYVLSDVYYTAIKSDIVSE